MYNFGGMLFLGSCLVLAAFIFVSVRVFQVNPQLVRKIFRYFIIFTFFMFFSVAAIVIGYRISDRHITSYSRNLKSVQQIWGGPAMQTSPIFSYETSAVEEYENAKTGKMEQRNVIKWNATGFQSQDLQIRLDRSERKKGLLLFAGYNLFFNASYILENKQSQRQNMRFQFPLPSSVGNLTEVNVLFEGKPYSGDASFADGIDWQGSLNPGEKRQFVISYRAQGSDAFRYRLSANKVEINQLKATLAVGYPEVTFPEQAMIPTTRSETDGKTEMLFKAEKLITDQDIAINITIEGNYGAMAAKLYFYAPLSLGLFLLLLLIITVSRGERIHPMNYLFIMAGFFVFYLLGSYLFTYLSVPLAILLALLISTSLMLYYTWLLKKDFSLTKITFLAAFIFQWFFSVAFFFPEHTGLFITLASIIAFTWILQITAKVDWNEKW